MGFPGSSAYLHLPGGVGSFQHNAQESPETNHYVGKSPRDESGALEDGAERFSASGLIKDFFGSFPLARCILSRV